MRFKNAGHSRLGCPHSPHSQHCPYPLPLALPFLPPFVAAFNDSVVAAPCQHVGNMLGLCHEEVQW